MKKSNLYYKIGAWALVILGIGHPSTHLLMTKTEEQMAMAQSMKQFKITLLGTESNMLSFYNGFSLIMGFSILSYGLLNLVLIKYKLNSSPNFRPILLFNSLISIATCLLSIQFFYIVPPILFTGIASLAFALAYLSYPKKEAL